jgi:thiol-disulfide isomerase/thioredoxin
MPAAPIITHIHSRIEFMEMLHTNPGIIIVKLGATWCKPCKMIEPEVKAFFNDNESGEIGFCNLDVDENEDVYSFLRTKKMVTGIPTLLRYDMGNLSFAPNASFSGTDKLNLSRFFKECSQQLVVF